MEGYKTEERRRGGEVRVQRPLGERRVLCEVTGEFSLPDYQPQIQRLLRVSATVQPPNHYVGGGSAEFSGRVDFCVLYAGNDGGLYCFADGSDYVFRVPVETSAEVDLAEGLVLYADCEPDSVIGRVGGPRRLSVKCRLRGRVYSHATHVFDQKRRGDLPRGSGEEQLLGQVDTARCGVIRGEPMTLTDRIPLESDGGEWRIISGDAEVLVSEASCQGGRVAVRGETVVKLMVCREGSEEPSRTLWRKLPFETELAGEGVTVGGDAAVGGVCTELSLSMEEGGVVCEVEQVLEARCQHKETLFYTTDWYATGCDSRCETEDTALPRALRCINANLTVSEVLTDEQMSFPPETTVVDCAGTATVDGVESDRGRYIVGGKCRYSLILRGPDGEMSLRELELPFRYTAEGAEECEHLQHEGSCRMVSARAKAEGGRLSLEAELYLNLRLWCHQTIHMVRATEAGEPLTRPAGRMMLCYPAREDTLWSVGKRYHAPMEALATVNRLNDEKRADAPDSLSGVRVLVV